MSRRYSVCCSAPLAIYNENDPNLKAVAHFEAELARIAGVHDAKVLKSDPAFALGNLFGRFPLSRTPFLSALKKL